jgi:hypothetical protein
MTTSIGIRDYLSNAASTLAGAASKKQPYTGLCISEHDSTLLRNRRCFE